MTIGFERRTGLPHRVGARLRAESGQATVEYAATSFAMILGGAGTMLYFLPAMVDAYNIYIHSFYMVLGLPIP